MTDWRVVAIRHAIETESLHVVDHWRVWARTRDANGELVDVTYDAGAAEELEQAITAAIGELARKMFPCSIDTETPP